MNLFQRQSKKGKVGEDLAYNYLLNTGWEVEDTTGNPAYYDIDIDFLMEKDGHSTSLDVKTEEAMTRTGNMFIETGINYANGKYKKGWLYVSKAEYIWHVNPDTGVAFAYRLEEMNEYLKKSTPKWGTCNDEFKTVDGRLVKPEEYKVSGNWWQEINLKEIF